jgi:murein L,D-transpeptidase YafK
VGLKRTGLLVLLFGVCACATTPKGAYADEGLPATAKIDRIVVSKEGHTMAVYAGETLLKTYRVAIGKGGEGPKRMEGDNRTPEGSYVVDGRHHSRQFHRFLHLSYPNKDDRKAFQAARKAGEIPKDARLGGAIGIHGEKRGREWLPHKLADWTQGCIALDNDEIEELYERVEKGAVVEILP